MSPVHAFLFGVYPYIALTVFLLGSLLRFEREQYTWRSESTQLLYPGALRLGSILFHVGVLGVFGGHLAGLLTPIAVFNALGITHEAKQMLAMVAGGLLGGMAFAGLNILIWRRLSHPRLRAATGLGDRITLFWLWATLALGLSTIAVSAGHRDGAMMVLFMQWAQGIVTLRADAAYSIVAAPWLFKLHMTMGMTLFVLFPFTRLVHVWSGFATVGYLTRAWQLVRPR
ncbi:respiratory nitrate reductase subunit gamma [Paludibacterium yongneupense]|uniref:respiratory nitrate reductase subunit gamma n=1 Tax=Paludibacterium yongneupense TaxID=400061 RepID=UPI0003F9B050|nr:respiratory nitrate reductase subunit gamma [Paludibacterium yongneupense]